MFSQSTCRSSRSTPPVRRPRTRSWRSSSRLRRQFVAVADPSVEPGAALGRPEWGRRTAGLPAGHASLGCAPRCSPRRALLDLSSAVSEGDREQRSRKNSVGSWSAGPPPHPGAACWSDWSGGQSCRPRL